MADTFVLTLNSDAAWYIRSVARPGLELDFPEGSPGQVGGDALRLLRRKINQVILQLTDQSIETVDIDCTEDEAWLIDSAVSSDGGQGIELLLQLFHGLHYLEMRKENLEP